MTAGKSNLTLLAVGDVAVSRDDPDSIFALVAPTIKKADIAFCQLETIYSERGSPQAHARGPLRAHPSKAAAIKTVGFNVVSFASNHCMDFGIEAFQDTLDALKSNNLPVVGAGKNIAEARQSLIVDKNGTRVAFLAYCSILPFGYWAEENRPGCTPMRGHTIYEQVEPDQPGSACRTITFAHKDDLKAMVDDIKKVRSLADIVIVSHHWGLHFVPAKLAQYQKEVGYAAIDAGADLILGHHAHILKGIEVYKGKVIFYSLCNFGMDVNLPEKLTKGLLEMKEFYNLDLLQIRKEYPKYPFPVDSRKTIMVNCTIADKKITNISYLPVFINKEGQPEILARTDKRSDEVFNYMKEISDSQNLGTEFAWDGDKVTICTEQGELKNMAEFARLTGA